MQPTVYQKPEIRDANDNIIQQGAFGKNTALANATNDGWIDYVANDLEFLYDLAKDEVVPVPSLPASGQTNKTYLLTTTGVSYRWSGTQWVAVSSSEAVGRAESAALLAEQWATKTDGTVDGTEYSAKYYAGLAEASADDAQDVADDMADHLVQIDKNTGGVAKNSKRISNIEKLLSGNLFDYDTDDDEAYTKTVPAGALPYAGVESIGGKTLVMNQLVKNQDVSNTGDGITTAYDSTTHLISITNDSRTTNFSTGSTQFVLTDVAPIIGHKYIVRVSPHSNESVDGVAVIFSYNSNIRQTYQANTIATFSSENSANGMRLRVTSGYDFVDAHPIGNVAKYYINVVDLTLAFGAGNEPSTVAEFEAMFPADYYPYNVGTLLSAGVESVESMGKNLWKMQMAGFGGYYNVAVGSKVGINGESVPMTDNGDGSFTFTTDNATWHGALFLIPVDITKTHRLHFSFSNDNSRGTFYLLAQDYTVLYKSVYSSPRAVDVGFGGANTEYPTAVYACVGVGASNATNVTVTVTNPMVEVGETSTTYVPYKEATTPIPAEVRALEGYGWSAGTAYNYIDYERKVYVQNVGRVDLGSKTWTRNSESLTYAYFSSNSVGDKKLGSANIVCPLYVTGTTRGALNYDKMIAPYNVTTSNVVVIRDDAFTDATELKTALNGIYAYYELATPVETDISAYLTDNLIEVGAGGTLTFPNANGNDYHIPVPSTETYMIDLQEAISNG